MERGDLHLGSNPIKKIYNMVTNPHKGETTMKMGRLVGIAASAALLVAGCGSSGGATTNGTSSTGTVTITVAAWNDAADALKAEIPGFEKQYPNIKVNVLYVDTGYTKIMPELASGSNVPDFQPS
jgi:ABC-type glycerol-3-phosphate transport system substrate-binding protein